MDEDTWYIGNERTGEVRTGFRLVERHEGLMTFSVEAVCPAPKSNYVIMDLTLLLEKLASTELSDFNKAALMYLATYIGKDGEVIFGTKSHRRANIVKAIGRHGLDALLSGGYVTVQGSSFYIKDVFFAGRWKSDTGHRFVFVFKEYYRALFEQVDAKQQALVGGLINAFPSMNINWNVLCADPREGSIENSFPCNQREISELMNKYKNNQGALIAELTKINFVYQAQKYRLCIYDKKGKGHKGGFYISPYLFYSGSKQAIACNIRQKNEPHKGFVFRNGEEE